MLQKGVKFLLLFIVATYRTVGTTHMGGCCRFEPSCSEYAVGVISQHPPLRAIRLIGLRVLKCRPGGPSGYDPVPLSRENGKWT